MNCPGCKAVIKKTGIVLSIVEDYDFVEVEITCEECNKVFFARIAPENLIECE